MMGSECYFCSVTCTEDDWCDGCEEYVCEICAPGADGEYDHNVDEHVGEEDY